MKGDHLYVGQVREHFKRGVKSCDVVVGCIQYTQFPAAHHRQKVSLQHGRERGYRQHNNTTANTKVKEFRVKYRTIHQSQKTGCCYGNLWVHLNILE